MASKDANRPSQKDQEFVTNAQGEKVRNRAYVPSAKKDRHKAMMDEKMARSSIMNNAQNRDKRVDEIYDDIHDRLSDISESGHMTIMSEGAAHDVDDYSTFYAEMKADGEEIDGDDKIVIDYGSGAALMDEANEKTIENVYSHPSIDIDTRMKQISIPVNEWERINSEGGAAADNMNELFESIEGTHVDYPLMNDMDYESVLDDAAEDAYNSINIDSYVDEITDYRVEQYEEDNPDATAEEIDEFREDTNDRLMSTAENAAFKNDIIYETKTEYDGSSDEMTVDAEKVYDKILELG